MQALSLARPFFCVPPQTIPYPALETEEAKMTDWCPHPCQLLVLLFQLPFQLPQVFLNVAMTFLSLGAGTVSHLGDLCSFCSSPIGHMPWCQGGLGDQGLRCHRNQAPSCHPGAGSLSPLPISFLLRANLKTYAHQTLARTKGIIHGKRGSTRNMP